MFFDVSYRFFCAEFQTCMFKIRNTGISDQWVFCHTCYVATATQNFKNFRNSSLWHVHILAKLRSQNKKTMFLMILACLCRFNSGPLFTTLPQHKPNSVFECIAGHTCPENAKQHMMMTQCWVKVDPALQTLEQCRKWWANIKAVGPDSSKAHGLITVASAYFPVTVWDDTLSRCWLGVGPSFAMLAQHWAAIGWV